MRKEYDLKSLSVKRRGLPATLKTKDMGQTKVRVTIALDSDVVEHFKKAAARRGALPYQTQINRVLREVIEQSSTEHLKSALLKDKSFIRSLAREIAGA
jgi:uncharacterized protein (DUF4415 family)